MQAQIGLPQAVLLFYNATSNEPPDEDWRYCWKPLSIGWTFTLSSTTAKEQKCEWKKNDSSRTTVDNQHLPSKYKERTKGDLQLLSSKILALISLGSLPCVYCPFRIISTKWIEFFCTTTWLAKAGSCPALELLKRTCRAGLNLFALQRKSLSKPRQH